MILHDLANMFMPGDWESQTVFFIGGLFMLLVVVAVIAMIEAFVLFLVKWNSFEHSFRASTLANAISAAGGIVLLLGAPALRSHEVAFFLGCFVGTVAIEGLVLQWMRCEATVSRTWAGAFLGNWVTYTVIGGLTFIP